MIRSIQQNLSLRTFSKHAGFKSPNFFKLVMDGDRNLTEDSLELLAHLGFIKKDVRGPWQQASPLVTTGAEVASVAPMHYHQNLLDLTKEKMASVLAAERNISSFHAGVVFRMNP